MSLIHKALKKLDTGAPGQRHTALSARSTAKPASSRRTKVLFVLMLLAILFFAVVYSMKYISMTGTAGSDNARPEIKTGQNRNAKERPALAADIIEATEAIEEVYKDETATIDWDANELYRTGEFNKAIELLSLELKERPKDPVLLNNIGLAYFGSGQTEPARSFFTRALSIKPDYAEAINNYGAIKASEGKSKEAIKLYNKAIAIRPAFAEAHFNIAVEYEKSGKYTEARRAYEVYLKFGAVDDRQAVVKRIKELRAAE